MDPCKRCGDDGIDGIDCDGRYCDCAIGEAKLKAAHDEHAWMESYVEQARTYAELGEYEAAEAIKKAVCS